MTPYAVIGPLLYAARQLQYEDARYKIYSTLGLLPKEITQAIHFYLRLFDSYVRDIQGNLFFASCLPMGLSMFLNTTFTI